MTRYLNPNESRKHILGSLQDAAEYFEFSLQETHVMDAVARSTLLALVVRTHTEWLNLG